MSFLPQDVLRDIMRCVHIMDTEACAVNNPSSHAAALVCKNWLAPARENLFRNVRIRINPDYRQNTSAMIARLMKVLTTREELAGSIHVVRWSIPVSHTFNLDDEFPGHSLQSLAKASKARNISHSIILSADYAHNSQVLAMLDLAPELDKQFREVMWHLPEWSSLEGGILDAALALMRRLDQLDRLELSTNFNDGTTSFPTTVLTSVFPVHHIMSLSLLRAGFASSAAFNNFLSSFTRLSNLELHHVVVAPRNRRRSSFDQVDDNEEVIEGNHLARLPPLRAIKAPKSLSGPATLMQWISDQTEIVDLQELNLHGSTMYQLSTSHTLRTLRLLELDLTEFNKTVDLSACTALSTLTYFDQGRVSHIVASLNTVNSAYLATLTIRTNSSPEHGWDTMREAFQRLYTVRPLHFRLRLYPNKVRDVVSQELKGFEGREWISWL